MLQRLLLGVLFIFLFSCGGNGPSSTEKIPGKEVQPPGRDDSGKRKPSPEDKEQIANIVQSLQGRWISKSCIIKKENGTSWVGLQEIYTITGDMAYKEERVFNIKNKVCDGFKALRIKESQKITIPFFNPVKGTFTLKIFGSQLESQVDGTSWHFGNTFFRLEQRADKSPYQRPDVKECINLRGNWGHSTANLAIHQEGCKFMVLLSLQSHTPLIVDTNWWTKTDDHSASRSEINQQKLIVEHKLKKTDEKISRKEEYSITPNPCGITKGSPWLMKVVFEDGSSSPSSCESFALLKK